MSCKVFIVFWTWIIPFSTHYTCIIRYSSTTALVEYFAVVLQGHAMRRVCRDTTTDPHSSACRCLHLTQCRFPSSDFLLSYLATPCWLFQLGLLIQLHLCARVLLVCASGDCASWLHLAQPLTRYLTHILFSCSRFAGLGWWQHCSSC